MRGVVLVFLLAGCDRLFLDRPPAIAVDAFEPCDNLETDPDNCGVCGHSCNGGSCMAGTCQPIPLARDLGTPRAIALSATHVYWVDSTRNNVMRVLKAGGEPELLAMTAGPMDLGVDTEHVYWGTSTGVVRCKLDGCAGSPAAFVNTGDPVTRIALTATHVAFLRATNNEVLLRDKQSAGPSTLLDPSSGQVQDLAVGATGTEPGTVYWSVVGPPVDTLRRYTSATSDFVTAMSPGAITADGTRVCWIAAGTELMCADRQTTATTPIASGLVQPRALATSAGTLWFGGGGTVGYLRACTGPCSGALEEVVASMIDAPMDIAVDATDIYWSSAGPGAAAGAIFRFAR